MRTVTAPLGYLANCRLESVAVRELVLGPFASALRPSGRQALRGKIHGALVVLAALLVPQLAQAQPAENESAARVMYEAGASAYAAGRFEAAVQALARAYALSPRATVLFSLAQAERRLFVLNGELSVSDSAVAHFKAYLEQVPQGGRRADAVQALGELAVLRARPAEPRADARAEAGTAATRLLISVEPPSAEVRFDGVAKAERPLILETTPGPHTLVVEARGYFGETRQVSAVKDGVVATEIRLRAKPGKVKLSARAGTQVWMDGTRLGTTPLGPLEIEAGKHRFDFRSPGYAAEARFVSVARGAEVTVAAVLQLTTQRKVSHGLLVSGSGAAFLGGAAAVMAWVFERDAQAVDDAARGRNLSPEELSDHNRSLDRRDGWRTVSVASLAVAAGLLIGGGVLYAWNPETASVERSRPVRSSWYVGAEGAGLRL